MTDSTENPGTTPDQPHGHNPIEVNSAGEAAAAQPDHTTPAGDATGDNTTAVQPVVPRSADSQPTEVFGSGDGTVAAQAPATPGAAPAAAQQHAAPQHTPAQPASHNAAPALCS